MNKRLNGLVNVVEKELKAVFVDRVIELAKELISIPTINPPGANYGKIMVLLTDVLRNLGFDIHEYRVPRDEFSRYGLDENAEDRISIVAFKRFGKGGKKVHIHTHYDVVPLGSG